MVYVKQESHPTVSSVHLCLHVICKGTKDIAVPVYMITP